MQPIVDFDALVRKTCTTFGRELPQFCKSLGSNFGALAEEEAHSELMAYLMKIIFEQSPDIVEMNLHCAQNEANFSTPTCDLVSGDFSCQLGREMLPGKEKFMNIFIQVTDFLDLQTLINAAHSAISIIDRVDSPQGDKRLENDFLRIFVNVFSTMPFKEEFSLRQDFEQDGAFEAVYKWDETKFRDNYSDLWDILKKIQTISVEIRNEDRSQTGLAAEISNVGIKFSGFAKNGNLVWFSEHEGEISLGRHIKFTTDSKGKCAVDVTFTVLTMFGYLPIELPQICCSCSYEANRFHIGIDSLGPATALEYLAKALVPLDRIRELLVNEFSQEIFLDGENNLQLEIHLQLPRLNSFLLSILKMIISKSIRDKILFFRDFFHSFAKDLEAIWNPKDIKMTAVA